jgi:NitT/TauT family transport system substrate-binding protein
MRPFRGRTFALVGALLAALALAGCASEGGDAGGGGSDHPTAPTKTLRISATGTDSLPFMAILQVGINKGWFRDAGLDVSLYSGGGGGDTLRVVTSGDADLAIAGNTSVVLAAAKPASHLAIVAPWFQVNDFYWLASKPGQALPGATLGFSSAGSTTELIVKALQKQTPSIKTIAVGAMGDNWAATRANRITAGWAMHPFVTQKEQTEGASALVTTRDVIGDFPADLVAANTDYAQRNPANLRTFFTVADRLMSYVATQPGPAAADLAPLLKIDPTVMAQSLTQTPELAKAYSLKVDAAALTNLSRLMVDAGQISAPVDWKTALDQQYLPDPARTQL